MKKICFIGLVLLLSTGCGGFSEIEVGEVKKVEIKGIENSSLLVGVRLPVKNPSVYRITVLEMDTKVYVDEQYIGRVTSVENIVLPGNSDDIYDLTFSIRLANLFSAALSVMKYQPGQQVKITLDGNLTARSLLIKRTIPIKETREVVL